MDPGLAWTFVLLLSLQWTSSHSDPAVTVVCDDKDPYMVRRFLIEGESLWYVPDIFDPRNPVAWYWNTSQDVLQVSGDQTQLVFADGSALFHLNATSGPSSCFMAREQLNSSVEDHFLKVSVVPKNSSVRYYGKVEFGGTTKIVHCPVPVSATCDRLNGTLSWYKDSVLLPDKFERNVIMSNPGKEDAGVYDCVCTWTHQKNLYRSMGSRPVYLKEPEIFLSEVKILSPTEREQPADIGERLQMVCSVFCGTNVLVHNCRAWWRTETTSDRYSRTKESRVDESKSTIVTEVLSIAEVSAEDFQQKFECVGNGLFGDPVSHIVLLRARQSMWPLVTVKACVFLLFVLMIVMMKCFYIDLALGLRSLNPVRPKDKGVKDFDAYVLHQLPPQGCPTEEALAQFVSRDLPHVLEEQCGYRLFILGRDDLPGEDRVEQVEERMTRSRRLMVVLAPDSGSEVCEMYHQPEGFDWQVGLHQALVQRDLRVILVQFGDPGPRGYSHLPPALQHLIQKRYPLRYPLEPPAARANTRFWKRVRYLMPSAPVGRYPMPSIEDRAKETGTTLL